MVSVDKYSQWPTGYCANIEITNNNTHSVSWQVTITVDGTINNSWNANFSAKTGQVTLTGLSHNATLQAGASVKPGFCATR